MGGSCGNAEVDRRARLGGDTRALDRLASRGGAITWLVALCCVAGASCAAAAASAAPGDLDPSFSGDGRLTSDLGRGDSRAAAVVRQPDGRIVLVGRRADRLFGPGSLTDFALARYNADGSPDATFSGDGRQATDVSLERDHATAVALQPDGKIVVAGSAGGAGGSSDFAVARYNADGSLDTTFSGDGKLTTDFDEVDEAAGVAVAPGGAIVVVGTAGADEDADFALARYDVAGNLDATFSGDGKQTTDISGGGADRGVGVALQPDGKIVAGGTAAGNLFAVARYGADGTPDATFSGDGMQTTNVHEPHGGWAAAVALQSDGAIVLAGGTAMNEIAVVRYDAAGSLDETFSDDGVQTTADAMGVSLALAPDGKLAVLARTFFSGALLARYNADGSPDATLDGDGRITVSRLGTPAGLTLQPDGKIVSAGSAGFYAASHDFAVVRHEADGSVDSAFSGDGAQTTEFAGAGIDEATAVAVAPDGRIVAAGSTDDGLAGDLVIARYDADGARDMSFSGDGVTTDDRVFATAAMAVQPNGKILAAGASDGDFGVVRFDAGGSPDAGFGSGGIRRTDFGGFGDRATALALQADGKIVVAGSGQSGLSAVGGDFALARHHPDGSPDLSFSADGEQLTDSGGDDAARAVAITADGRIVVVGTARDATTSDVAVLRYDADGSLDASFSGDGRQTIDFGGADSGAALALQADGRIVVAGTARDGVAADFALARLNADGSLDPSFSGDGKQTTDFLGATDRAAGAAVMSSGEIVVAGQAAGGDGDLALARYTADGSLDASFSGDGRQLTDFAGSADRALALVLAADGKIVAAGSAAGSGSPDFALARYENGRVALAPGPTPTPTPTVTTPTAAIPTDAAPAQPAPATTVPAVDARAPIATLSARRSQRLGATVIVGVTCHDEPCSATVAATVRIAGAGAAKPRVRSLTGAVSALARGAKARVALQVSPALRAAIRSALRRRRAITVNVQARVVDAADNAIVLQRSIRLTL